MKNYRSFSDVEESYFRDHPEEMDEYMVLMFEEYAKDGDTGALLSSLRVLSRVKGVTKIAEETGLSRKGIQKALSGDGNPGPRRATCGRQRTGGLYTRKSPFRPAQTANPLRMNGAGYGRRCSQRGAAAARAGCGRPIRPGSPGIATGNEGGLSPPGPAERRAGGPPGQCSPSHRGGLFRL